MTEIATRHGVSLEQILGRTRCKLTMTAKRDCALHFMGIHNCLKTVGRIMGRDHSTIIYYLRAGNNDN